MTQTILLTGGAGYIGSHTCVALQEAGFDVVMVDDFSNARPDVPDRIARITGRPVTCHRGSVLDRELLRGIFAEHDIAAAVHFAARKAVGESIERPLDYLETNVSGLIALLQEMAAAGVFRLVFSSSATVYGQAEVVPVTEAAPRGYENPYGLTKLLGEQMLEGLMAADPRWEVGLLRYFNPVGAHASALIGEEPDGLPNNLMPYIARVATGALPHLNVFGDDYDTPDGTGIRDYIHVCDLAEGHVQSLAHLMEGGGAHTVNLGTGQGTSVLEMLAAYSAACGRALPHEIRPRRAGDVARMVADPTRARALLGFEAKRDLARMCASSWAFVQGR